MADPKEWGSILWKILHTCCENLGKHSKQILQNDEIMYFNILQRKLANILPCKVCKLHYLQYMKNIKDNVIYNDFKTYGKQYYYNLHKEINEEKLTESIEYDNLKNIYGIIKYNDMNIFVKELNNLYLKYLMLRYVNINDYKEFQRCLSKLRHIIDI